MDTCYKCGQVLTEWVTEGGRRYSPHTCTPDHGRGSGVTARPRIQPAQSRKNINWYTDGCRSTNCPRCHQSVYFVRHNGGSVWLDALGPPWPKHGCFYDGLTSSLLMAKAGDAVFPTTDSVGVVVLLDVATSQSDRVVVYWDTGLLCTFEFSTSYAISEGSRVLYSALTRSFALANGRPVTHHPRRPLQIETLSLEDMASLVAKGKELL